MKHTRSFLLHLLLFIGVEIIFIFILFREFPTTDIFTAIGVGHAIYWLVVISAGVIREYLQQVRQRFLATYLPVIVHVVLHFWIGVVTIQHIQAPHTQSTTWLILGTIGLGGLIFWGERLIHRRYHCKTHHRHAHKQCRKKGHEHCEQPHSQKKA